MADSNVHGIYALPHPYKYNPLEKYKILCSYCQKQLKPEDLQPSDIYYSCQLHKALGQIDGAKYLKNNPIKTMEFEYIKRYYKVPADMNREVIVGGKKGVIIEDKGNYIGVLFYDTASQGALPCHPTWEVEYLETFNHNPPIKKLTRSQKRYQDYLHSDSGLSFKEWIGID